MPYKVIEQRDFGGGLNTAVDPMLIRPDESPAMLNVDVTDTNAITRRSGYARLTATAIAPVAIRDITRYYLANGVKYWVAVAGTHLYAAQDATRGVPLTRKEFTTSNLTATGDCIAPISNVPGLSGGAAVVMSKAAHTISATLPFCSRLTLYGHKMTGSVMVDSGAWTSLSATSVYGFGAITATTHTLSLKAKASNTKAVKLTTPDNHEGASVSISRTPASGLAWGISFYDTGFTQCRMSVYLDEGLTQSVRYLGSATGRYLFNGAPTSVARSVGWHKVVVPPAMGNPYRAVFLDGEYLGTIPTSLTDKVTCRITNTGNADEWAWFDHYLEDGAMVDDFDSLSGWTVVKNLGSETATIDTDHEFVSESWPLIVDCADYSADAAFGAVGPVLSATASTVGFATLNNKLYYGTGYNDVRTYNGATTAAISASGTTKAAYLTELKRRLFAGGIASDQSMLNYTSVDVGHDWAGGGVARLAGLDSGGDCTGIAVFDDKLFWFGESRFYGLLTNGTDDQWQAYTLSNTHGCIAPRSLAVAPSAILFLSADGVRAYGPVPNIFNADGSDTLPMSINIAPTLAAYTDAERKAAVGAVYKNRYWLAIGGDVFVADLVQRTKNKQPVWVRYSYTGPTITCMHVTRGDEYGLYAGCDDGRIYRLDFGDTDNGSLIAMSYLTAPLAPGGSQSIKHFRTLHVAVDSPTPQSVSITPTTDDVSGSPATVTVDGSTDSAPIRVPLSARGRSMQLKIESDGANQPITLSSVALTFAPPRMR